MVLVSLQILSIALLFFGESLAIYSEISGAHNISIQNDISLQTFGKFFVIISVAGGILLGGYLLGILVFKNIWIVSVVSILSILIMEPILSYVTFKQFPTNGAIIGLALGSIGLVTTLVVK